MQSAETIARYNDAQRDKPSAEIVSWAVDTFGPAIKMACGFGPEGVVLLDIVCNVAPQVKVFTLDTGRLPEETHELMERLRLRYRIEFEVHVPERVAVEELVRGKGAYSFRRSREDRQECCHIRKVEPLKRALAGQKAWLTAIRREQSVTRRGVDPVEWDDTNALLKVNPLAAWTLEDVWKYIRAHDVPYNKLHERGYPSIGCAPCTRAVVPGEDVRAGRWWWELPEHKECGLHVAPADRL
jgi:phosphoadenosine phosphosulfate reductase